MERDILTLREYEIYKFIKKNNGYTGTLTNLAKLIGQDKSNLRKRIIEIERKQYIIKNGDKITIRKE